MGTATIDKSDFDTIYELHKDSVFQTAADYIRDVGAIEDIAQEVFFRYYVYMDNTDIEHVRAWLLRITRNLCKNHNRDNWRESTPEEEFLGDDFWGTTESGENDYITKESMHNRVEYAHILLDRMQQKNEKWHDAVCLVYGLAKPQKEAAECLGITLDSLQAMLRRAKQWVQKEYEDEYNHLNLN